MAPAPIEIPKVCFWINPGCGHPGLPAAQSDGVTGVDVSHVILLAFHELVAFVFPVPLGAAVGSAKTEFANVGAVELLEIIDSVELPEIVDAEELAETVGWVELTKTVPTAELAKTVGAAVKVRVPASTSLVVTTLILGKVTFAQSEDSPPSPSLLVSDMSTVSVTFAKPRKLLMFVEAMTLLRKFEPFSSSGLEEL
jgi:hypothetical protein